jgi:hypothetical protein
MKKVISTAWLLALGAWLAGCGGSEPKLDARWRFAGADGLRAQTAAPALQKVLSGPAAAALGSRLATNAGSAFAGFVAGGPATPEAGALAMPLVGDLLDHESAGEVWRHSDGSTELLLAVKVTAERAALWTENFPKWVRPLHAGTSGASVSAEGGWLFAMSRSGSALAADFRRRVSTPSTVSGRLLELETAAGKLPGIQATVVASNGAVRWNGTLRTAVAAAIPTSEWSYPTNLIGDSVIAFTAARGLVAPLLEQAGLAELIQGGELSQMYLWSQPETPFSTYGVVHADKPAQLISRVHDWIRPQFSTNATPGTRQGLVMYDPTRQILALSSAPVATPTLAGPTNGQPGFVGLSFVGLNRSKGPLPKELLAELLKPGVLYYDWEMTSENIAHWSAGLQVKDISAGLRPPPAEGPGRRFLEESAPYLENAVTVVSQKSPGVFELQRKTTVGLTSFELVLLTRWLDPPTARPARPARPAPPGAATQKSR